MAVALYTTKHLKDAFLIGNFHENANTPEGLFIDLLFNLGYK